MKLPVRSDGRSYSAPSALEVFLGRVTWGVAPGYCICAPSALKLSEITHDRVKVMRVQDHLSVASTFKTYQINVGGQGGALGVSFANLLLPPKYITKQETLKTSEKTWEDLDEKESYVKTGDPVLQVIEPVT